MFGIFKSRRARAVDGVADFIPKMLAPYGKVPAGTLRDPYCLGFLQMVGVHVASQSLEKGSGMDTAKAVFEEALKQFAPNHASEAAELLSFLHADESYLRGKKDGDLYMGWKLLHFAPQRDGEAALDRFFDRVKYIASPPQPPPPPAPPVRAGTAGASVSSDEWQVENKSSDFDEPAMEELSRTYKFSGLKSPDTGATLKIVCALECSLMNDGENVNLGRRLRFYLSPFKLPHEAPFEMRLTTMDGTKGGEFDVLAEPVNHGSDTALIAKYAGKSDVANCLTAIMSGKDMIFTLRDENESLVSFGLPNDREFKRLYDETCERLKEREVLNGVLRHNAKLQNKQPQATQPSSNPFDEARKNPKGYAVWMHEPNPGEYAVLLVKLNSKGGMAGAWVVDTLPSRKEQGTVGLELARDLQITLNDIVASK
jgi:hypothetical protein